MNTPKLETEKLILRKFTQDDLHALYEIYSDRDVNKFLPWFPLENEGEVKSLFEEKYAAVYSEPQGYAYAICLRSDNYPIGYIKVDMNDSYDLGYGLRKEFWHRGIVSEASQALAEQLKKDGIPYITATHDVNNPHSGGVMRKIGMEYKYSYEELWQPKNFLVTFRMYQLNLDGNKDRIYKKYWNTYEKHFVEENV